MTACTAADLAALRLPATPELLDGWCGPIMVHRGLADAPCWVPGVWLGWDGDNVALLNYVAVDINAEIGWPEGHEDVHVDSVYLDMARAECRDRVARFIHGSRPDKLGVSTREPDSIGVGEMRIGRMRFADGWHDDGAAYFPGDGVPTLADLDPEDPRLLPDGSRYVDALALMLVCRHLAGVTHG